MKKIVIAILMVFSMVALAYDSCPCPDGDPGHVDHNQTEAFELCVAKAKDAKSYEQCYAEMSNQSKSKLSNSN